MLRVLVNHQGTSGPVTGANHTVDNALLLE